MIANRMFSKIVVAAAVALTAATGAMAADKSKWPKSMTLGTASVGGTYFIYGGVVASLLTEKLGIQVSTQQTQGPVSNLMLVNSKKVELGMTTLGPALQAWNGEAWAKDNGKMRNMRAVFPMYDTPFHFVTLKSSGIKSVADMNGKTIGVGPKAGTCGTYFPMMFDALGMKVTVRYGGASDMGNQLGDGLIDVFAFCAGVPISAFSAIDATKPAQFITYTADEIAKLKKAMPELSDSVIPKGTYTSQTEDHKTVGLFNFFMVHKDLPDDLVYEITKAVMENNDRMVQGHSAAKETVPANAGANGFLTFHPGAVKYFKEKGVKLNPGAL
ncbi:MAG: TAXI family TRAP transporter solute-binding subunit [Burkholderiaceae bacterium]